MTAEDIWDYHVASGLPLSRAKELLSAMPPDIRERVLLAVKQKGGRRLLVDPIEIDSALAELIRRAEAEANRAADSAGHQGKGRCHFVWSMQKRILAERHGISWLSPADMNPAVVFD
ncbi:hypothetical protein KK141_22715 [Dyella sp. LX-66]|uniref:hypothetical protein n=1 Tax=unclassified Dyella TaxID=2634549 RepID=UPI001BE0D1B5|nr:MULTISPECIES: hypothetical protein [unclassified Dyella]MBT2118494.1 hypothetical protein [Dyella sp. LX-1]MBT2142376.1 hypothetical protein [Dyella sp. LX-66]